MAAPNTLEAPGRNIRWTAAMAGLLALAGSGCGFTSAPVRYFEVRPTTAVAQTGNTLPSVVVPDFECLPAYDHLRIVLRKSPVEVVTSRNLQWTTVPGRMLAQGLRTHLKETDRFKMVRRAESPDPRYAIEGRIQLIELNEEPSLTARLALQVSVRRTTDGQVITEDFVDETRAAQGGDAVDGILALRQLYSDLLDGLSEQIITAIEGDMGPAPTVSEERPVPPSLPQLGRLAPP